MGWYISYPTAGRVTVYVDEDAASNEEEAIESGWDLVNDVESDYTWEAMPYIIKGNFFYGDLNEIEVEHEYEDE